MNNQFGDERIIVRRNDGICMGGSIHSNAGPSRHVECGYAARAGNERIGVLRVNAALDAVAPKFDRSDGGLQPLTRGNAYLRLDQIDSSDQFGHRVLDLNARIHLNEIEGPVLVHQELYCARIAVANLPQGIHYAVP